MAAAGAIPSRERCATRLRADLAGIVNEWRSAGGSGSAQLVAPVYSCRTTAALVSERLLSLVQDDGGQWDGWRQVWAGWTVVE